MCFRRGIARELMCHGGVDALLAGHRQLFWVAVWLTLTPHSLRHARAWRVVAHRMRDSLVTVCQLPHCAEDAIALGVARICARGVCAVAVER